jgi:WD40 repeat protein
VLYLSWSPNGNYLVSSGRDGTVRIWEAETGTQLFILLHQLQVTMAEWSPTGDVMVTKESSAFLWNIPLEAGLDEE